MIGWHTFAHTCLIAEFGRALRCTDERSCYRNELVNVGPQPGRKTSRCDNSGPASHLQVSLQSLFTHEMVFIGWLRSVAMTQCSVRLAATTTAEILRSCMVATLGHRPYFFRVAPVF